jgi:hypothetical protein
LESRGLPRDWLDPCIAAWQKLVASSQRRAFRDTVVIAPILVSLISRERRPNAIPSIKGQPIDRRAYLAAVAVLGPSTTGRGSKTSVEHIAACHEILSRASTAPVDMAAVQDVYAALSPHLQGKTDKLREAVVCYVAWQCGLDGRESFNATARAIGVPSASLRSALESLARSMHIEWKGTATQFDGAVLAAIAEKGKGMNGRGEDRARNGRALHHFPSSREP